MKYIFIILFISLSFITACNNSNCNFEDAYNCNPVSLKKLYNEFVANGERRFAIHYVLVPDYSNCCSGKIDYMHLAEKYKDTAATEYPLFEIIFIKSEEGFWGSEMMPDDQNLYKTGLAKIQYQDSIPDKSRNASVSFFSY